MTVLKTEAVKYLETVGGTNIVGVPDTIIGQQTDAHNWRGRDRGRVFDSRRDRDSWRDRDSREERQI